MGPAMGLMIYILDRGKARPGVDRFALVVLRDGDPLPMDEGWRVHWQGSDIAAAREAINRMRKDAL